jgi:signal transduction histidine kinase
MAQIGIRQCINRSRNAITSALSLFLSLICDICVHPFRMESLSLVDSFERIEYHRRVGLLRLIILGYILCLFIFAVVSAFFKETSPFLRWSDFCMIVLSLGCLILSYHRWTTIITIFFLFSSLAFCLALIEHDINALNERSLIIYSFISLLIVMAGILLPHKLVWIVAPLMIGPTLISLATMPLRTRDPRMIAIGSLLTLYLLAVLLTWLYVRSTTLGERALAEALSRERSLREQRDMFINIASHELRTPLTPLLLDCRLIERRLGQQERNEQLASLIGDMIRHLKRMDAMIGILLDASRISLDQFEIRREQCDIAQTIREAVSDQEQLAERSVMLQGAETPIIGVVDARRIWQVMSNLVGNALKYSSKTDVVSVCVTEVRRNPGRILRVVVSDTGPGIPPQSLPHVFERHYRVHKERSDRKAGLGLGLYISATIVRLHGGEIWVESELGQGSTFTFELPL